MELVDVYNKRREKTGIVKDRHEIEKGEYRLSAHIWILDGDNLLIQQRVLSSKKFPGLWSQTGGAVDSGESSLQACLRECKEELGLDVKKENVTYVGSYTRTRDIVDIFLVEQHIDESKLSLQTDEVKNAKIVTIAEFENMIKSGIVVPSINPSFDMVKLYLDEYKNKG